MRQINVELGYKVECEGEETRYYSQYFADGNCYKDYEAFKTGKGICYIPEGEFDDAEQKGRDYVQSSNEETYTGTDIFEEVSDALAKFGINDDSVIEYFAEKIFNILGWEYPITFIEGIDWDEELNDYYEEKLCEDEGLLTDTKYLVYFGADYEYDDLSPAEISIYKVYQEILDRNADVYLPEEFAEEFNNETISDLGYLRVINF